MLAQVPGALLARRYGARRTVGAALLGSSLLSALVPLAAPRSVALVYAVRAGQGLCQGCLWPGYATLWSAWAPPAERARLSAFPQVGGFVGTLIFEALGGWQCDHPSAFFGGWAGVFHLQLVLGLCWVLLWAGVGHNTPRQHPWLRRKRSAERESFSGSAPRRAMARASKAPRRQQSTGGSSGRWHRRRPYSQSALPTPPTTLATTS